MLSYLFQEQSIGPLVLKNRITMPAMHLLYSDEEGGVTERLIEFYRRRAEGGVAMVIIGVCHPELLGKRGPRAISLENDRFIPGLTRLVEAVHSGGAKVAFQIGHAGRDGIPEFIKGQPVSSSPLRSKITGIIPRQMTVEEIKGTIENLCEAARRVKEAGADAIEYIGSAGTLIAQFLSPYVNKRTDAYGGALENRTRFLRELLTNSRAKLGADFPIILKLSGADFVEGGVTVDEAVLIAKVAEESGVSALSVTGGFHESLVSQITMDVPRGALSFLAERIKRAVSVPVVACNRINDPEVGEEILRQNKADLISMGRALIADPDLPNKAKRGHLQEIRRCVACNQGCFDHVFSDTPVACMVNPEAGRERQFAFTSAVKKKKVMIVGGGPAGMQAAITLAERGHQVVLFEARDYLGGRLFLASMPPGRRELRSQIDYYKSKLQSLKVDIILNTCATSEVVRQVRPNTVIIATGATPAGPPISGAAEGLAEGYVAFAEDILSGKVIPGRRAVIIGAGGTGCETALFLAEKNSINAETMLYLQASGALPLEDALKLKFQSTMQITIVDMKNKVGEGIGRSTRWVIRRDLQMYGIKCITPVECKSIIKGGVYIIQNGQETFLESDTIILATGVKPDNQLYQNLKGEVPEVYIIGDADIPRTAFEAIHSSFETALKI